VELDPEFFDGWHALGMALLKQGNVKQAIGAGLQATTLKPNDLLAWTGLSQMYVKDSQIAEAEFAKGNARILSLGGKVVKDA
jgi:Flp pilus assembly protein TadD